MALLNGFPGGQLLINNLTTATSGIGPVDAYQAYLLQRDKAAKSTAVSTTLAAASWIGTSAPYTYTLEVTGVTTTSNQELIPATTITSAQLKALQSANIVGYSQTAGSATLRAWGTKPGIDIPVIFIVRGDA